MKTEVLARSPVLIAALATLVALVGVGRDSIVPVAGDAARDTAAVATVPAAAGEIPLIGELTVVAGRVAGERG